MDNVTHDAAEIDRIAEALRLQTEDDRMFDVVCSLGRYVSHGILPGSFLQAVLANDLLDAIGRADDWSLAHLKDIAQHVYNRLPADCHGSRLAVAKWRDAHRVARG